jgi:hypothetical protein
MDIQAAFNIAMGLISALGGWWMKTIYDALRDLRNDHSRLQTQVQQVEVVVAGDYLKRSEFDSKIENITNDLFRKLDKIEDLTHHHISEFHTRAQ